MAQGDERGSICQRVDFTSFLINKRQANDRNLMHVGLVICKRTSCQPRETYDTCKRGMMCRNGNGQQREILSDWLVGKSSPSWPDISWKWHFLKIFHQYAGQSSRMGPSKSIPDILLIKFLGWPMETFFVVGLREMMRLIAGVANSKQSLSFVKLN